MEDFQPGDKVQIGTGEKVYTVIKATNKHGYVWLIGPEGRPFKQHVDRDIVVPDQTGY
jgi:hypothetical protein